MSKFIYAPESMTLNGALALKIKIVEFWRKRGRAPVVKLVPLRMRGDTLYCIRSDINPNWL